MSTYGMTASRAAVAGALFFAAWCWLGACSDSDPPKASPTFDSGAASDSARPGNPTGPQDGAADADGADAALPTTLGNLTIEDVADTACSSPSGAPSQVASDGLLIPDRLARLAPQRWAAEGSQSDGVLFIDEDGGMRDAAVRLADDFNSVTFEGDQVGIAGTTSNKIIYRRFDGAGAPLTDTIELASDTPNALFSVADSDSTLVLWASSERVHARRVSRVGSVASVGDLLTGVGSRSISMSATPDGAGGFRLLASSDVAGGMFSLRTVTLSAGGVVGTAQEIFRTTAQHAVLRMVKTNEGYAALLEVGASPLAHLLLLDANGAATRILRLKGASRAFDMATRGNEFGILAKRANLGIEFRSFQAKGDVLAPWVCLPNSGTNAFAYGALASVDTGYRIAYSTGTPSVVWLPVGHLGTD
jgi:hypothetical protein